ncbi:MAG TPA: hypothetical protein PKE12_04030 [Kiritimatiellia bacterium]|nr:hypothetical protein [Kiritimatiellia bacterium]
MTNASLKLPIIDDRVLPPPRLTPEQRIQRMTARWAQMTEAQREAQLRADELDRFTVPFRLDD